MKSHLSTGTDSRKTLCGITAGFDIPGIPVDLESPDVCAKCARLAKQAATPTVTCNMDADCTAPVTHIGSKGYVYCTKHAVYRRSFRTEYTRKMRAWELRWILSGRALPSYTPGPEPK